MFRRHKKSCSALVKQFVSEFKEKLVVVCKICCCDSANCSSDSSKRAGERGGPNEFCGDSCLNINEALVWDSRCSLLTSRELCSKGLFFRRLLKRFVRSVGFGYCQRVGAKRCFRIISSSSETNSVFDDDDELEIDSSTSAKRANLDLFWPSTWSEGWRVGCCCIFNPVGETQKPRSVLVFLMFSEASRIQLLVEVKLRNRVRKRFKMATLNDPGPLFHFHQYPIPISRWFLSKEDEELWVTCRWKDLEHIDMKFHDFHAREWQYHYSNRESYRGRICR